MGIIPSPIQWLRLTENMAAEAAAAILSGFRLLSGNCFRRERRMLLRRGTLHRSCVPYRCDACNGRDMSYWRGVRLDRSSWSRIDGWPSFSSNHRRRGMNRGRRVRLNLSLRCNLRRRLGLCRGLGPRLRDGRRGYPLLGERLCSYQVRWMPTIGFRK
jgi:hypothetical protein